MEKGKNATVTAFFRPSDAQGLALVEAQGLDRQCFQKGALYKLLLE